jgi:hypothetical protein
MFTFFECKTEDMPLPKQEKSRPRPDYTAAEGCSFDRPSTAFYFNSVCKKDTFVEVIVEAFYIRKQKYYDISLFISYFLERTVAKFSVVPPMIGSYTLR